MKNGLLIAMLLLGSTAVAQIPIPIGGAAADVARVPVAPPTNGVDGAAVMNALDPCNAIYTHINTMRECPLEVGRNCVLLPVMLDKVSIRNEANHVVDLCRIRTMAENGHAIVDDGRSIGDFLGMDGSCEREGPDCEINFGEFLWSADNRIALNSSIENPTTFTGSRYFMLVNNDRGTSTRIAFSQIRYTSALALNGNSDLPQVRVVPLNNVLDGLAQRESGVETLRGAHLARIPLLGTSPAVETALTPPQGLLKDVDDLQTNEIANSEGGCQLNPNSLQNNLSFAYTLFIFAGAALAGIRKKLKK